MMGWNHLIRIPGRMVKSMFVIVIGIPLYFDLLASKMHLLLNFQLDWFDVWSVGSQMIRAVNFYSIFIIIHLCFRFTISVISSLQIIELFLLKCYHILLLMILFYKMLIAVYYWAMILRVINTFLFSCLPYTGLLYCLTILIWKDMRASE